VCKIWEEMGDKTGRSMAPSLLRGPDSSSGIPTPAKKEVRADMRIRREGKRVGNLNDAA